MISLLSVIFPVVWLFGGIIFSSELVSIANGLPSFLNRPYSR